MYEYVSITSKFGGLDDTYSHKTLSSHPPGWKFATQKKKHTTELKSAMAPGIHIHSHLVVPDDYNWSHTDD